MTVLVFRIGQLGDTVVSLPALTAIRNSFPGARLVLLTNAQPHQLAVSSWEILEATGFFDQVLFYSSNWSRPSSWVKLAKAVLHARRTRPYAFFYLAPYPRSRSQLKRDRVFFRTICGVDRCYGFDLDGPGLGLRRSADQMRPVISEVDRLLLVVAQAGVSVPPPGEASFRLPIRPREIAKVDRLWSKAGLPVGGMTIALGPGSKMQAKRWPVERFVAVAQKLIVTFRHARLVVLGSTGERQLGEAIVSAIGESVTNWAGSLTVLESAEALRRCSLYVGNDTGTMHLAAAVGTKCVAVFSARDRPGKWEPYGSGHFVLRTHVPCAGCMLETCIEKGRVCLMTIGAEEVYRACVRALSG